TNPGSDPEPGAQRADFPARLLLSSRFADRSPHGGHDSRWQLERKVDVERATASDLALDPDPSAHELGELSSDGKAEAGASVLAGAGPVDLLETLEDQRLLVRRNSDAGVDDSETYAGRIFARRLDGGRHAHGSLLGELDRVADEVDEDLTETYRVADDLAG